MKYWSFLPVAALCFMAAESNGAQAALQQTLDNVIGSCIVRNWDIVLVQGSNTDDLRLRAHFRLKRDGSLDGKAELTPAGGDAETRNIIVQQALAAIRKCAPFKLPPDKYEQWRDVTINMHSSLN